MQGFSLGRKVDVRYKSNLWLLIVTALVVVVAWFLTGSVFSGLGLGGGFFLCWALAREVDPAHDISAFVAGGIFLLFPTFYDGIEFGVLFLLLLLMRLISRICGNEPSVLDLLSLFGLTGYLTYARQNSSYFFLLTFALVLAFLRNGKNGRLGFSVILGAGSSLCCALFLPPGPGSLFLLDKRAAITVFLMPVALGTYISWALEKDRAIEDDLGKPLEKRWIRLSNFFYVIAVLILLLFENISMSTSILLFSVMAGVTAFRIFHKIMGKDQR